MFFKGIFNVFFFLVIGKKLKKNKYKIDKFLIKKCNKMLLNFNFEVVFVLKL